MGLLADKLLVALLIAYPILVHASIILQLPELAIVILIFLCLALLAHASAAKTRPSKWQYVLYLITLLISVLSLIADRIDALYLPQILINLGLATLFARTLQQEQTPIVERIMRTHDDHVTPSKARFARQLTTVWVGFFCSMAAIALVLAVFGTLYAWSLFANIINYVLVALFFFAQLIWSSILFKDARSRSSWIVLRDTAKVFRSIARHENTT